MIVSLPVVIQNIPDHSDAVQLFDTLWCQIFGMGTGIFPPAQAAQPAAQFQTGGGCVFGRDIQMPILLEIGFSSCKISIPVQISHAVPNHADFIQLAYLFIRQKPSHLPFSDGSLIEYPLAQGISIFGSVPTGDFQGSEFFVVGFGIAVHDVPGSREGIIQPLKQLPAILDRINHM